VRECDNRPVGRSVLVTGGGGFIGSNLVRALLEHGERVRILDNFITGSRLNLSGLEPDLEIIEGDLRSPERVHAATRGVEVVFHQGALPSVPRSIEDPLTTNEVNAGGTLNVLLAARDCGVRRVVFASSSSIYGAASPPPLVETMRPVPLSPYAVSKLAAEAYCTSCSRVFAFETVALRYFNVYGPGQDPRSPYAGVVPRFLSRVAAGAAVEFFGDGSNARDFTYVADVVEANLLAAESPIPAGCVVNVATGRPLTVSALADTIGHVLGRPVEKVCLAPRPGEVGRSWAEIGQARRLLGYEPRVALEEGLRQAADALAATGDL
jgi:UDP-N-acetylglucosamine/UDP-N-acetyl-alpha-D-glucosaminouronate 4-epimerase